MPAIKDALDIIGKLTVAEQESLKTMLGVAICLITYAVCEIVSNIIEMNYLVEIIALIVGTIAIGGFIGFIIGLIVSKVRK